jgi:hypothetical protein
MRPLPTRGRKSPRYGHLGLWVLSLGPSSPVPGERLELAIIDDQGRIVRRFEQIEGRCLDPGYVDFFLGSNCRPARHEMPLVDIAPDGKQSILCSHYATSMGQDLYLSLLGAWCTAHGRSEWAL